MNMLLITVSLLIGILMLPVVGSVYNAIMLSMVLPVIILFVVHKYWEF